MGAFDISFAQKRLWLLDRLMPDSVYNLARMARLNGLLDVDALRQALNEVVRRHHVLRSRFAVENAEPAQAIVPELKLALEVEDLGALPEGRRRHEAQQRVQDEAQAPFDLEQGPLVRARLLRMGEHEHWLLLTFHHIVSDDWSMKVLWRELSTLYDAHRLRSPSLLAALPMQYADYAQWQREWLQEGVLDRQLTYLKQALAGLTVLRLPADRVRPAQPSYRGRQLAFALGDELTRSLRSLSHREGTTFFTTLLAALQVLLYRYSGQEDVAVGVPVAGRRRPDLEGLIGFFVNTLVLRGDLSGEPSFRDYLGRVRLRAQQAYAHQDIPFEMLVEKLHPKRDSTRNPLFQVMLNKWNPEGQVLRLTGLESADVVTTDTGTAKFDLGFTVVERQGQCRITIEYATDLFDAATIERLAGHFTTLIEAIVANPEQCIGRLPLLSEAECHQLLVEWNDTAADYPRDRCIHQLFEEQAARTPEAVAVVFEDRQLTYGELNARANQLAHHLISLGVGPEVLVGICLERSLELIVGLLGILKAGGAYVPFDPAWPSERARLVMEDARLAAVVTQRDYVDRLPPVVPMVFVDPRSESGEARAENNPDLPVSPADPVYVLYTSGTTGLPKGVLIEHQQLVQYVRAVADQLDLDARGNYAMLQPLTVDSCQTMIFPSLGRGGTLHLISEERALDATKLTEYFGRHHIDYLKIAPSHLAALLNQLPSAALLPGRALIIGGEASHWDFIDRLWSLAPRCAVWNHYGPTETTVGVSVCRLDPADSRVAMTVPIGRPLANVRYYVLDQNLRPVPFGLPGELCIGGEQVARGYLDRPESTVEKFLPDPFSEKPNARLYRSGDQVRYLIDGKVEFLGRKDQQIKIRGFRIEMGEIEAVLRDAKGVREVAVSVRDAAAGGRRLVAFVVPDGSAVLDDRGLKASLATRLPDYMVPSQFILLPNLPLTPHGKVDRKALEEMDTAELAVESAYVAPRNSFEELITEVWCEVLKLEQVGMHDNFFELGGHSLLAAQVLARLTRLLNVELPLRGFFETPTVSALAEEARKRLGAGEAREATPIALVPRDRDLPLSFAQERLWFLDRLLLDKTAYNVPTAWRLQGPLDAQALQRSVDELVARHETLRTRFTVREGEPVQVIDPPHAVPLPLTDLSAMEQAERKAHAHQIANAHARQPFDLEAGPLLRAQLLRLAAEEHLLLLNVHHIASDGWSVGVFERELSAAYGAFVKGQEPELPALPIQYADYAAWQREWLQGEVLQKQLGYWKSRLAGVSTLELPTDRARPPVASHQGAHLAFDLPGPLTGALKEMGRREGATLFMTLLAAFQVLLHRYNGQEDIAVGSPIAGRGRTELEGLIGFFVNTLVLRSDLSGNPRFRDLLGRVRESALGAYTHQDLPFEKLVEELAPARDMSRNPLFQVLFVLQNAPSAAFALEGVEVSRLPLEGHSAKFDLSLSVRESAVGLHASWEYTSDLFNASTIERMARHFERLLEAIVADPEQCIGQLPLLNAAERHQLLVEWNDTAADYPGDRCIHQLFEEQAARTPEAAAVEGGGRRVSYREIDERAERLAERLRAEGMRSGSLVAICLERSIEMVVAFLAVWKAKGAYVPIDPGYPAERVRFMLEDTQALVMLTQRSLAGAVPATRAVLLRVDAEEGRVGGGSRRRAQRSAMSPEQLAYVIYTSGSTGRPKGVPITHRSLFNLMRWHQRAYEVTPADRATQIAGPAFDASAWEIWPYLTAGASVHIPNEEIRLDPGRLVRWLIEQRITLTFLPTPLAEAALRESWPQTSALRVLLTGGDKLNHRPVHKLSFRLINHYGPTENTVVSTCAEVSAQDASHSAPAIGRPLPNTRAYVLDSQLQPVPIGVPGELLVGGVQLASGYWNRPELTAEKFVPDPFSGEVGARLYRTGDLVRYLPDGNIEYLGRIDDQVKIRGFRIELGEIEAVLAEHPAVRQAVVLAREGAPGDKRLVAYVVPADASLAGIEPLRAFLRERLPEYMRPAAYVRLERLPLTPNGKVDRKALETLDGVEVPVGTEYVPPRNERERTLVKIWQALLGREQIGVQDNFFDLGGHSLLAIKFISLLREREGVDLPVSMLFESPTPATLAERFTIENQTTGSGEAAAIGTGRFIIQQTNPIAARRGLNSIAEILGNQLDYLRTWKGKRSTPESFIVTLNDSGKREGLFWCLQGYRELAQLAGHLGSDQPVHGMRSGHLVMENTDENVDAVASHYAAEMIALRPDGSFLLGGNCQGGTIARAIALRLRELGRTVALLILMEQGSFPSYDDPVALIFGRDSHFNPYQPDADPEVVFRNSYPAGFTVDIIAGAHGEFFESPNVETLASTVNRRLPDPSPGWRLRACLETGQES